MDAGFRVLTANSGPEALAILGGTRVDVLLTDVVMPEMSGVELILESRKIDPLLIVFCMTGGVRDSDVLLDQLRVIRKPFRARDLVETITQGMNPEAEAEFGPQEIAALHQQMREARLRWLEAKTEMDGIIQEGPNVIPHPDNQLRIESAGRKVRAAYHKYKAAFDKYRNALNRSPI